MEGGVARLFSHGGCSRHGQHAIAEYPDFCGLAQCATSRPRHITLLTMKVCSQDLGMVKVCSQDLGMVKVCSQDLGMVKVCSQDLGMVKVCSQDLGMVKVCSQDLGMVKVCSQDLGTGRSVHKT